MASEPTQRQSTEQQQRAQQLSMQRSQPPATVPGHDLTQFLGSGAYGEVWIGVDQNTGRRVAVKFYLHRGGVDWSLLSREVEKLVLLSADRYVVQLLDVGWDSDPPYYVMEYVEHGSLDDLLRREGSLAVPQAVELFREIAVSLVHAHAKGVLHCDLKPANILLDQDHKPRLADFGQSRLSHEQTPALGTLFYMAPEQADLEAVPDAQWDVYALGAILYCMLTGAPPHRDPASTQAIDTAEDLTERLRRYRQIITERPPPVVHRRLPGMDRALIEIVDRCLALRPSNRFANVQEVLDAIRAREVNHHRRPLMVLGILGPVLLLLVMVLFGYRGYLRAIQDSSLAVTAKVKESNRFAAQYVASKVAAEVDRYYRAVESVAEDPQLQSLVEQTERDLMPLLEQLANPPLDLAEHNRLRGQFINHPQREALQTRIESLMTNRRLPPAASWFICDPLGNQLAAVFDRPTSQTIGNNYAYRTYFHGGLRDLAPGQQPPHHLEDTHLSALLKSTATQTWKVAVSTPMYQDGDRDQFLGIVVLTVEVGNFITFFEQSNKSDSQFAVLVDGREGDFTGVILQHPLFSQVFADDQRLPPRFSQYRVDLEGQFKGTTRLYRDPLAADPLGQLFARDWVAAKSEVELPRIPASDSAQRESTGLFVLIQQDLTTAIVPVQSLGQRLAREGLIAMLVFAAVVFGMWFFVLRGLSAATVSRHRSPVSVPSSLTPNHSRTTLPARRKGS